MSLVVVAALLASLPCTIRSGPSAWMLTLSASTIIMLPVFACTSVLATPNENSDATHFRQRFIWLWVPTMLIGTIFAFGLKVATHHRGLGAMTYGAMIVGVFSFFWLALRRMHSSKIQSHQLFWPIFLIVIGTILGTIAFHSTGEISNIAVDSLLTVIIGTGLFYAMQRWPSDKRMNFAILGVSILLAKASTLWGTLALTVGGLPALLRTAFFTG